MGWFGEIKKNSNIFIWFEILGFYRQTLLISSATSLSLLARTKLSSHQLMIVIGRPVPVLVTFCIQIYVEQLSSGTRTSIELCIYGTACLVILNLLLQYTSLKLNYMNITLINWLQYLMQIGVEFGKHYAVIVDHCK
jgi:hypothetical protein